MRLTESKVNIIAGAAIIAFCLAMVFLIIPAQIRTVKCDWFNSPRLFPYVICGLLTALGVWLLTEGLVKKKKIAPEKQEVYETTKNQFKMVGIVLAIIVAYVFLLDIVGYIPCTIVMLAGLMYVCGQRNWLKIAIVAVVLTLVIYFGFSKLLSLRMP